MNKQQFLEDIALISKDKWAAQILSFNPAAQWARRFRNPRESKPFGFEFMDLSIEVHPVVDAKRVAALNIFGVLKDGRLRLLLTEPV